MPDLRAEAEEMKEAEEAEEVGEVVEGLNVLARHPLLPATHLSSPGGACGAAQRISRGVKRLKAPT